MHGFEGADVPRDLTPSSGPWWKELNRYHWFVLIVAALGWLFDTMDQQLFNLARVPAMKELLATPGQSPEELKKAVDFYGPLATSVFMIGWATGGLVFGVLGDRVGRAKVMLWTILIYSLCTGLSAFSIGFWDFAFYRFLTGLGVGGEFAVGVSLVAEVMPNRARPFALGLLQALSAVGNVSAAFMNIALGQIESHGHLQNAAGETPIRAWRILFLIGTVPALLAIFIRRNLKEPETWQAQRDSTMGKQLGSFAELFGDPRWRKNAIVGLILASSGIIGLWGIGFFTFDLLNPVFRKYFEGQGLTAAEVNGKVATWVGITSVMQNIGGFFGIYAYSYLTHIVGRKPAFAAAFIAALGSTLLVYSQLDQFQEIFWMIPLMGFCQLALFGGYAIYFPELFPTRLRSTGTSFCYNVGRYVAAVGPFALGMLTTQVFSKANGYGDDGMRYAGMTMCAIFLIGLMVLPFAPETKGKPLPE